MLLKITKPLKPMRFFSTAHYPLLLKRFPNKCDSNSFFTVTQLEEKDINEAAACLTEAFYTREMITTHFQIKYSLLYENIKKDLQKALDSNLCLVCKDKMKDKIAGVIYYEGLRETLNPKNWQDHMEQDENWKKFNEFYFYLYSFISQFAEHQALNNVLLCKKFAVAEEFLHLGVATNLIFAARYIHPRITKAKRRLMITSSENTYNYVSKHGWEVEKLLDSKDLEFFNCNSDSRLGKIYILKYEPKAGKTLIQELKELFQD